ncbi:hypothetical protein FA15DRAFT_693190 [Coprinopsis marcescibilis]|uniref:F-box domain-containing protein n=1 Tax=Coprinopsis marcescibilis TaxID=230819 RepID=A0A5C3L0D8_COPMA|nr:hypothetical protein FA15DRAFT_693190 [Coprinopsis marcescibilis]
MKALVIGGTALSCANSMRQTYQSKALYEIHETSVKWKTYIRVYTLYLLAKRVFKLARKALTSEKIDSPSWPITLLRVVLTALIFTLSNTFVLRQNSMKLLPVEIIEQIITLACIDNSRNDYEYIRIKRQPREYLRGTTNIQIEPSTAVVLTHVSKLWRGIAISTKDIWKKVEVVFTILPDQKRVHPVWVSSFPLASAFKRSDPSPIEVLIEGWRNRSEGSDDKWHDDIVARKVFAAQLWRWRSLELVGGSELSDLQSEWGLRLTQLQQVKLYGCPALQILPLPLRQIRDLALDEHATGIRSYGIENLLRVLSKLLSLETLRIRMTQEFTDSGNPGPLLHTPSTSRNTPQSPETHHLGHFGLETGVCETLQA